MKRTGLLFFVPGILLFILFYMGPVCITLFYSLTDKTLTGPKFNAYDFIGFGNFVQMYQDPRFVSSIGRTISFLVFSGVIGQQVLGFMLALLKRGKNAFFNKVLGVCVLTPWIMPEVVAGFSLYAYLSDSGTLNTLLSSLGTSKVAWLITFPMAAIIVANIWRGTAFSMMVFSSALDAIPKEIEESASLEGCYGLRKLMSITLPLVKESIMTNSVLVTFQTIGSFGLIFLLTGGGPSGRTQTLPLFMYDQAFIRYQIGYGTAISLVLLLLGMVLSLGYISFKEKTL